ncbi:MAG TPA: diguanylate cyclase [Pirellulaceae bacterium]|nr:diguanylate cyclase [Pirellulaceae bacterium]
MQSLLYLSLGILLFLVGVGALALHLRSLRARAAQKRSIFALQDLATKLARDVDEFDDRVRSISGGLEGRKPDVGADEVLVAVEQISRVSDVMRTKLKDSEEKLRYQSELLEDHARAARTDAVTGLPNLSGLEIELEQRLAALRDRNETSSLLKIELGDLRRLAAAHGPDATEAHLKAVAKAIAVGDTDEFFAARCGEGEFAVVFHGWDVDRARHRAERIRLRIDSLEVAEGFRTTASAGLVEANRADSPGDWLRRTDDCLEEAKRRGSGVGIRLRSGALLSFDEAPPEVPAHVRAAPEPTIVADETVDPITGLPNRAAFLEDLKIRLATLRSKPGTTCLAMLRIDRFGDILSDRGFRAAETVLLRSAESLKAAMRGGDHAARFDRDTFVLFLTELTPEAAPTAVERLRASISQPVEIGNSRPVEVTASSSFAPIEGASEAAQLVARCRGALAIATTGESLAAS